MRPADGCVCFAFFLEEEAYRRYQVAQKLALKLMETDALNLARPSWLFDPCG